MGNCLFGALIIWWYIDFGKFYWYWDMDDTIFPHFCIKNGNWIMHYRGEDSDHKLIYDGEWQADYVGEESY